MRIISVLTLGLLSLSGPATAGSTCLVDFDNVCPTETQAVCGVRLRSNVGCVVDGLGQCYDTGAFAVRVNAGETAIFRLPANTTFFDVFFADTGGSVPGQIRVLADNGAPLTRIFSNGDCTQTMPAKQEVNTWPDSARWLVVRAGDSNVYVDSLEVF
jgi:hypothetical protein